MYAMQSYVALRARAARSSARGFRFSCCLIFFSREWSRQIAEDCRRSSSSCRSRLLLQTDGNRHSIRSSISIFLLLRKMDLPLLQSADAEQPIRRFPLKSRQHCPIPFCFLISWRLPCQSQCEHFQLSNH